MEAKFSGRVIERSAESHREYSKNSGETGTWVFVELTIQTDLNPARPYYITAQAGGRVIPQLEGIEGGDMVQGTVLIGGRSLKPTRNTGIQGTWNNVSLTKIEKVESS